MYEELKALELHKSETMKPTIVVTAPEILAQEWQAEH